MFRLTLEEGGVFTSCEIRTIHQVLAQRMELDMCEPRYFVAVRCSCFFASEARFPFVKVANWESNANLAASEFEGRRHRRQVSGVKIVCCWHSSFSFCALRHASVFFFFLRKGRGGHGVLGSCEGVRQERRGLPLHPQVRNSEGILRLGRKQRQCRGR